MLFFSIVFYVFDRSDNYKTEIPLPISIQVLGESISISEPVEIIENVIPEKPHFGIPVRLIIPQINVDASILHMGITVDGNMEVPALIEELGWYKYGPNPGEEGSAVIAGHLGVGIPGVFAELNKLQIGDVFSVVDENNKTITFKVRETKIYDLNDRPREVFFSNSGYHLNLITCAGAWDGVTRNMSERLVVFTDMI